MPENNDFTGKVLWISVWDWNRFTKSEFLGEVMVPLWTLNLHDNADRCYPLEPVSVCLYVCQLYINSHC